MTSGKAAPFQEAPAFLTGRRLHIAGSASPATPPLKVAYAHDIVAGIVRGLMQRRAGLVLGVGKEPRAAEATSDSPPLTFDWTALAAAAEALHDSPGRWDARDGPRIAVVTSEKGESEFPESRRALWRELLDSRHLGVERIAAGSRAAALIRRRQADFGDGLLIIGGGFGVEDLAAIYAAHRRPVVPMDLELGGSRGDGTGGATRLAREARANPTGFVRLRSDNSGLAGTRLAALATRDGQAPPDEVVAASLALLDQIALPVVFYTRLLNRAHPKFPGVESFFRTIVDPVVATAGYRRVEIGTDNAEHAFINVAIFDELHYAPLVIADVTGERPNCFIELGYALGRGTRVLATAAHGTAIPFDQDKLPVHFWFPERDADEEIERLYVFWRRNVNRPSIIV